MAGTTVKTRIQLKNDTEENWNKTQGRFIPLKGEVIIYLTDDTHPFSRLKVGDGITSVVDLPFVSHDFQTQDIKYNTTEYWNTQNTYIPRAGEIIIYSDKYTIQYNNTTYNQPSLKIGDGSAYLVDLPFLDQSFRNHINNSAIHVSAADREFWNNKINCDDVVEGETLCLNRG